MNFRRLVTGGLLLLLGCGGWRAVPMGPEDYLPTLNVIALLTPDENPAVTVLVGRTLPLDSPITVQAGQDTVWLDSSDYYVYPSWASLLRVDSALVTISWDAGQVELVYDSTSERWGNFASYRPVDTTFVPITGRIYYLVVHSTSDGLKITGETTVPPATQLSVDPAVEPWETGDLITVHWAATTGNYHVGIAAPQAGEQRFRINAKQAVLDGDTSWSFIVPTPESFWWEDSLTLQDEYRLEVSVVAFDVNFNEYFFQGPGSDQGIELGFLFGGDFITQSSFGIEGGLGVFGSYRRATHTHLVGL